MSPLPETTGPRYKHGQQSVQLESTVNMCDRDVPISSD